MRFTPFEYWKGYTRFNSDFEVTEKKNKDFVTFLDGAIDLTPNEPHYTFDDNASRKLVMLLGPNWHTVVEAYKHVKAHK